VLVDFSVNGLIVVSRDDKPPVPPAGRVCEDAAPTAELVGDRRRLGDPA
jgi:hypothetical protein